MCMNKEGKYGKYIIQESILPPFLQTPEAKAEYYEVGRRRILWCDDRAAPNCGLSMNSCWIVHADRDIQLERERTNTVGEMGKPHRHEGNEILGFLGSDPDDPSDLCGEVEIYIEGEKHILTKSSYIYIPAGVKHVPLYINRVDRPIFHFFITLTNGYSMVRENGVFDMETGVETSR